MYKYIYRTYVAPILKLLRNIYDINTNIRVISYYICIYINNNSKYLYYFEAI